MSFLKRGVVEEKGDKKPGDLSWGKFYRVFQGDCRFIEHT